MEKEIYVIHVKESENKWTFVGGFKSSNEASTYYNMHRFKRLSLTSTIVPADLPDHFNKYFEQFKYCDQCDKYPHDNDRKTLYLIKKRHVQEWHFDCILPTMDEATIYKGGNEIYNIITLKVPYHKDKFFDDIQNDMGKQRRLNENKYYDKQE